MEIAFLLSFGQFLLLVCYLVSVSLLPHNVMISTRARFAALQVNGVERNRSVCRHAQTARRWRTRRVHSRVHTATPTRRVPFASTENTTRCGLSVPDEPDAVCTWATRRVAFANGTRRVKASHHFPFYVSTSHIKCIKMMCVYIFVFSVADCPGTMFQCTSLMDMGI